MKFSFCYPATEEGLKTLKLWQRECDWPTWRKVKIVDIKKGYIFNRKTSEWIMDVYFALCESDFIPFLKFIWSWRHAREMEIRLGWKFDNGKA